MLKMVFLINRRPDMEAEDFRRYWKETHAPIAAKLPGLRKYVQNYFAAAPDGPPPMYDGFAELWWDDAEAMEQSLASAEGQATLADVDNFLDAERLQTFIAEEVKIV